MMQEFFRRSVSIGFWSFIATIFSFFMASGNIALGVLILIGLLFYFALLHGPHFFAIFWMMGSPTIFGFPNLVLRPLPFVTMDRLLFAVLAMMVILKMIFLKTRKTHFIFLETIIIIFLSYAFISLVLNTNGERMMKDGWLFFQYAMPMLSFVVSRRIEWTDQGIKRFLACLTITGVFVATIGILQALFGVKLFLMDFQSVTSGHVGRAYGAFTNAHTFIATLFIFLIVTLDQFSFYRDSIIRFFLLCAMGLMAFAIVLGQTRAPWLGGLVAISVIFVKDKNIRPLITIGAGVAVILGFAVLIWSFDFGAMGTRISNMSTMAGRAATWATAFNMILDYPVFGIGFGAESFLLNKPAYSTGIGTLGTIFSVLGVPHNEFIHITVLLGVVGLALFLMILFSLIKLMFSLYHNENISLLRRKLGLYLGAIIIGLLVNSLFSDTYIQDYFWTATYFLAGLAASVTRDSGSHYLKEKQSES